MDFIPGANERYLSVALSLAQYPVLASAIREQMRCVLFERGYILPQKFEAEAREAAIQTQQREGLTHPYEEEPAETWEMRLGKVRDQLTDIKFSMYLPFEELGQIINDILAQRGVTLPDTMLSMNPELAPIEMVFEQAMALERMPADQQMKYAARLHESKVVLIRTLISDQLPYINVAKEWFTIADLVEIRRRKIGLGRIGGKAAGMLLAHRILMAPADPPLSARLEIPESYYVGSHEFYTFMTINNLTHWIDQKYKTEEEMRADYPTIVNEFEAGKFPPDIEQKLATMLTNLNGSPLIVRSSSLLEDNFGTSFAGKYDSVFLPNQGAVEHSLHELTRAIAHIYASVLNPNALLYRRAKRLLDYDERMAVIIQVVRGERFGRYYLPHAAGVAFSRNQYRWAPQIRAGDGFIRLVWGLGTRAVDRVGNDYPRLVALSHPLLRPSTQPKFIRRYSQQYVDLLDLEDNQFKSLPVHQVLTTRYPPLRYLAQLEQDGYFTSLRGGVFEGGMTDLVLTFDELLRRTTFADQMRRILNRLERFYRAPVDMEFALELENFSASTPDLRITILQCRPQSHLEAVEQVQLPGNLPPEKVVFSTHFVVPSGFIPRVDYMLFVPPEGYFDIDSHLERTNLARTIGKLNAALAGRKFICIGPGRWGSSNSDLGVPVGFGDIYNARSLVELAGQGCGPEPEPSLGTHFFQDLLESQIYPLAITLDDPRTVFNRAFFDNCPDHSGEFIQVNKKLQSALRLIKISDCLPGHHLEVVMDDDHGQAMAYLSPDDPEGVAPTAESVQTDHSQNQAT
ncbi:MAG: hypothetical protein HPY76_00790 [Anaerolineae bacterium]|nr:hypothetical protein [Anaerolineae bacterium]